MSVLGEIPLIQSVSIADQLFLYIKKLILSGTLKGGQRVPEKKIADKFGVSRTPVREALKRLESYGLISVKPRSYAFVAQIDEKEGTKIAQVREGIEALSVRLLMETFSKEKLKILTDCALSCNITLQSADFAAIFEQDSLFHLKIAELSENHYVYDIMEKLDAKIQLFRLNSCVSLDKVKRMVAQHNLLLENIKRGNRKEALELIHKHVWAIDDKE